MTKRIRLRHAAHVRANDACAAESAVFDATAGGQSTRAGLNSLVDENEHLFGVQKKSLQDRKAATVQCQQQRRILRNGASAIVNIGKMVKLDQTEMGALMLPGPLNDEDLMSYMRGLLDRVTPHVDAFVAAGLPAAVLDKSEKAIQGLADARKARTTAILDFAGAADTIHANQNQADTTITALESIALNTPDASPELMTKLRKARRIGPHVEAAPTATPPTPNPAPSPEPSSVPPTAPPADKVA